MVDECLDITNVNLDLDFIIMLFFWAWISGHIYLVNLSNNLQMYMLIVIIDLKSILWLLVTLCFKG